MPYTGRFAPSPTGSLHAGSLVAALASYLDAKAQGGHWLVRIEDVDTPRCMAGLETRILDQLQCCGLVPDAVPWRQSQRHSAYQTALEQLIAQDDVYPCACSRQDIQLALARSGRPQTRHGELIYPGTCRPELGGLRGRPARAWRLRVPNAAAGQLAWFDRRLGPQQQVLIDSVGDFILRRADGCWAYQLAVVVDDAAQGITHIVRGEDLADNTARQIHLQQRLGLPTPKYLHTPLVLGEDGEKLSKQNGAYALDTHDPRLALRHAAQTLDLHFTATHVPEILEQLCELWRQRWTATSSLAS